MRTLFRLVALLVVVANPVVATAADVTIESLLKSIPDLSTANPRLTSFQFRVDVAFVVGSPTTAFVGWEKPDRYGMIVTDVNSGIPSAIIVGKKMLAYDAAGGKLILVENALPSFQLDVSPTNISPGIGVVVKRKKPDGFGINVTKLITSLLATSRSKKLTKLSANEWRLECITASGRSQLNAVFRPADPCPLRSLELRIIDGGIVALAIRDIRVNERIDPTLRRFPDLDRLSSHVKVQQLPSKAEPTVSTALAASRLAMGAIYGQAALKIPKLRTLPLFDGADWENARRRFNVIAPALRRLSPVTAMKPHRRN